MAVEGFLQGDAVTSAEPCANWIGNWEQGEEEKGCAVRGLLSSRGEKFLRLGRWR